MPSDICWNQSIPRTVRKLKMLYSMQHASRSVAYGARLFGSLIHHRHYFYVFFVWPAWQFEALKFSFSMASKFEKMSFSWVRVFSIRAIYFTVSERSLFYYCYVRNSQRIYISRERGSRSIKSFQSRPGSRAKYMDRLFLLKPRQ